MKKHEFANPTNPMPDLAPNFLGRKCIHCGDITGLDDWQLHSTPTSMAKCAKGRVVSLLEKVVAYFRGGYNCLYKKSA